MNIDDVAGLAVADLDADRVGGIRCDIRAVDLIAISAAIQPPNDTPTTIVAQDELLQRSR